MRVVYALTFRLSALGRVVHQMGLPISFRKLWLRAEDDVRIVTESHYYALYIMRTAEDPHRTICGRSRLHLLT